MNKKWMSVIVIASALSLCWGGGNAGAVLQNGPEEVFGFSWGRVETLIHPIRQNESTVYERFNFAWNEKRSDFTIAMKHHGVFGEVKKAWSSKLSKSSDSNNALKPHWSQDPAGNWTWQSTGVGLYLLSNKYFQSSAAGILPEFSSAEEERQYLKNIQLELRWNPLEPKTLQMSITDQGSARVITLRQILCEKDYCRSAPSSSENELALK